MNITLRDYESVQPDVLPQNKCRSLWSIFHVPVILPYILKTVWCMNLILRDYELVWPKIWPQNKCRSLWPIFHGPVNLPYILTTIWWMNIVLWDYYSVYPTFDLKINLGCCDLHFMVQWFCLISWRLFDVWTSYFGIIYDPTIDFKINVGHCDLYFMVQLYCLVSWRLFEWSSDFALYLGRLMYEHHTSELWVSTTWYFTSK